MSSETAPETQNWVTIGKVKDAHGIRGELFVVLFSGEAVWLGDMKTFQLSKDEFAKVEQKQYAVKSARLHKNGFIAKTVDITTRNMAEELKGQFVQIPESFLISEEGEEIFLREILNFKVTTQALGEIGYIKSFSSNNFQDLLVVQTDKGEFDIPFVEEFVTDIDYENKMIYLDLPVGLLGEELAEDEDIEETDEGPIDDDDSDVESDESDDQDSEPDHKA